MKSLGQRKKHNNNRKGVVLVTVIMVMSVAFILIGAIIGFVHYNVTVTHNNYRKQQAFMTASTYLKSFVEDIKQKSTVKNSNDETEKANRNAYVNQLKALANANGGNGTTTNNIKIDDSKISDKNMGDLSLTIKRDGSSDDNLVIIAKCNYLGQEDQMAAHISIPHKRFPSTYTNALEVTGKDTTNFDNLRYIGGAARINSDDQLNVNYEIGNQSKFYSSFFHYGNLINNGDSSDLDFILGKNLVQDDDGNYGGANINITGNFTIPKNYVSVISFEPYVEAGDHNYLNVGGNLELSGGAKVSIGGPKGGKLDVGQYTVLDESELNKQSQKIDTYCTNLIVKGDSATQYRHYGNVYIKKNAAGDINTGNLLIPSTAHVIIYGDLYVENNIILGYKTTNDTDNLKVTGNIYLGGEVYEGTDLPGSVTGAGTTQNLPNKTLKGGSLIKKNETGYKEAPAQPEIPKTKNDYKYSAEYLLNSGDTSVSAITSDYKNMYDFAGNLKANQNLSDKIIYGDADFSGKLSDSSNTTVTAKFAGVIEDSFVLSYSDLQKSTNYKNKKFLIHVKNHNIIVIFKNGDSVFGADYSDLFVVKNDSDVDPTTGSKKYGVYFVSDSGIQAGGSKIENNNPNDETVYSWSGNTNKVNVTFDKYGIMDFDTYINLWKKDDLSNTTFDGSAQFPVDGGNVIFNPTDTSTEELNNNISNKQNDSTTGDKYKNKYYFTPAKGNIHVILTKGCTFAATNNSFFECEFYCPDASVSLKTSGPIPLSVCDNDGTLLDTVATNGLVKVTNIGVIVANKFECDNTSYFVFNQPEPGSIWGPLKGKKEVNLSGYSISRYDRY